MSRHEIELALAAVNPIRRDELDSVDLEAMDAELLADLDGEQPVPPLRGSGTRRHRRRFTLALGTAILAAVVALVAVLPRSTSNHHPSAFGAELVRFAESTPLLLLEGPGWRVQNIYQQAEGQGTMEFVTGKPVPYESIRVTGNSRTRPRQSGMLPAAVRQRRVELVWRRDDDLAKWLEIARDAPHPHGQIWTTAPVLETVADVDARAEFFVNQGGVGDRQMSAIWAEDGYVLEMRAAVPDLDAFEERLKWVTQVDSQTWLDAMPAKVVKAADHDAAVREMLKGIPVPDTFKASRVPDEGLTTNRYQVGAAVTGTVSCLWFRQWGAARRTGDTKAGAEAEKAMATSKGWPILHEMTKDGAYPQLVWELATAMPRGYWEWNGNRRRLLPHAEGLGCARWRIPVLPWKQRRQASD